MIQRYTKLRLRRGIRRKQRQAFDLSDHASEQLERHFIKRLPRVGAIQRFLVGWLTLCVLMIAALAMQWQALASYYLAYKPVPGGTYAEGMVGVYTNGNPLYATSSVDLAVSRLMFSGLITYDENNQPVGDLAEKWEVDEKGSTYTVHLRPGLMWHDGKSLTSDDVVFTIQTIQKADARSPLNVSWQGVNVAAVDADTVTFTLPSPLVSFLHSLTVGIVPKHILEKVPASQLRSDLFNGLSPIGSGAFMWNSVTTLGTGKDDLEQIISLKPNGRYHRGTPKLDQFIVHTYSTEDLLTKAAERQEVQGASFSNGVPYELVDKQNLTQYSFSLAGAVMLFMRLQAPNLQDVKVRQALQQATNTTAVNARVGYAVKEVDSAVLKNQIGYAPDLAQRPYSLDDAGKLLDEAGWIKDPADAMRKKQGKVLELSVVSQNSPEYSSVVQELQQQWKAIGVKLVSNLQSADVLEENYILRHDYDLLLYGIAIGPDPDVFAFWHSSQADINSASRLNLSEWKNAAADAALEAGRTRLDPALRAIKYRPFLEAWRNEVPAIALYQPRYIYVTTGPLAGLSEHQMNNAADRFINVQNWMIRRARMVR